MKELKAFNPEPEIPPMDELAVYHNELMSSRMKVDEISSIVVLALQGKKYRIVDNNTISKKKTGAPLVSGTATKRGLERPIKTPIKKRTKIRTYS
jgi:hypothetical protein